MSHTTRRGFMQRAGAGIVGLSALQIAARDDACAEEHPAARTFHRSIHVPGVHAYPLRHSIIAGETLELCTSASVPYRLSICRLGQNLDSHEGDEVLAEWDEAPAVSQPIHPGSCILIERSLLEPLDSISFECWIRPWKIAGKQAVFSQGSQHQSAGFSLQVDSQGRVIFSLHDDDCSNDSRLLVARSGALTPNRWQHLVATSDGTQLRIFKDGQLICKTTAVGRVCPGCGPLILGAMNEGGVCDRFLDADLAMPTIYSEALNDEQVRKRFGEEGLKQAGGHNVLACWPFTEERGGHVADCSGNARHGCIVNHATWMIGGPSFQADVSRFGEYDPCLDPRRGHGLRFASDDLYNCEWQVTQSWKSPTSAKPGIYVARYEFVFDKEPRIYHCAFLVRNPNRRPKAKIVVITATTTWRAYNGTPFALTPPELKQEWDTGGLSWEASGLPDYCLYRRHAAGQGTYQVGLHMPWPAAGPYVLYSRTSDYSHLMRADRFTQVWLEKQGYDFDILSGEDLHREPKALGNYQVAIISGHNEYWSWPMYQGLEAYLQSGGNLLVLSGNTMGWRVSFNDDCTIMECRKADGGGSQVDDGRRGEAWHSQDGLRGGHQRECGMPGYRLVGVDIIGWNHPSNPKNIGPYIVDDQDHFLFRYPEATGLCTGDRFGWAGEGQLPMANIHEVDVRLSTFAALQELPHPEGAVLPVDPSGMLRIANGVVPWKEGGDPTDYFGRSITPATDQGGEMIYWERSDGGRVFNASAIGSAWVLDADPRWAMVVRNVLHHFGVSRPGS